MNLECHSRGGAGRVVLCVLEVEICRPASAGRGPYRSGKTRAAHRVKNVCGVRPARPVLYANYTARRAPGASYRAFWRSRSPCGTAVRSVADRGGSYVLKDR